MSGEALREWRLKRGWTQKQAAEALGYSWRHYSRAEREGPTKRIVLLVQRMGDGK